MLEFFYNEFFERQVDFLCSNFEMYLENDIEDIDIDDFDFAEEESCEDYNIMCIIQSRLNLWVLKCVLNNNLGHIFFEKYKR